jgi:hypothetical protein
MILLNGLHHIFYIKNKNLIIRNLSIMNLINGLKIMYLNKLFISLLIFLLMLLKSQIVYVPKVLQLMVNI